MIKSKTIKPLKERECEYEKCNNVFMPKNKDHVACQSSCAYQLWLIKKNALQIKKDKKQRTVDRLKKREGLEKLKTPTNKANELQDEINHIARLIDYGNVCMCCYRYPKKTFGGHFLSVGGHTPVRFNLLNIYLCCYKCNGWDGGNVHGYDRGITETFGKDHWEYLKYGLLKDFPYLGLKKDDYNPLIKIARQIVKELKEDLIVRTPEERIELRERYNNILGIYKK